MFAEGQTIRLNPDDHEDSVDAFFDFNRLSRSRATLDFLSELLQHFARIPYENISKIINLHESLDWDLPKLRLPETVISQHIDFRLGGTCFSLTFYLQTILAHSGFTCYPVMADMRAGKNIHCCLIVILDSVKYLVDPGYLLTRPMALNPHQPKLFHTEFAGVELRTTRPATFTICSLSIKTRRSGATAFGNGLCRPENSCSTGWPRSGATRCTVSA